MNLNRQWPLGAAFVLALTTAACSSSNSGTTPQDDAGSATDTGIGADDGGPGPGTDGSPSSEAGGPGPGDGSAPHDTGAPPVDAAPDGGPLDPTKAPKAAVDRFSDTAAHLWKRSAIPTLPGPNVPVAFDSASLPFLVHGYGPAGQDIHYYNFDVQSLTPATVYVLTDSLGLPIPGQLALTDALPGDAAYNDLVTIVTVTTPKGYVANTVTSVADLQARIGAADGGADWSPTATNILRNLVTVPFGSTANLRFKGGATQTELSWYRNQVVSWLVFDEANLSATAAVDTSGAKPKIALSSPHIDIYVTFNKNPNPADPTSGPASGFKADPDGHVHNVVSVLPPDPTYAPLWDIDIYDNAAYGSVDDLRSALAANLLALNAAEVNCPVVQVNAATTTSASVSGTPLDPSTAPAASVDRFGSTASFFNRANNAALPAANAAINFDAAPFLVTAYGEGGTVVQFYNFDVQSSTPAQAYLFVNTKNQPVAGQLPVIDVLPGQAGYSDFFQVNVVTVPDSYVANTLHSASAVVASGLPVQPTKQLLEWVVVPAGSTASHRYGGLAPAAAKLWVKDTVVTALPFGERELAVEQATGHVPAVPVYAALAGTGTDVTQGFKVDGSGNTHDVLSAMPGDDTYTPLWSVNLYDPTAFASVTNLTTAKAAAAVGTPGFATLHAPVVSVAGQVVAATAPVASIDRFSDTAAHLWKRSAIATLPAANAPIPFDSAALPFLVHGFGPKGEDIHYYNFDVAPLVPRPVYILTNALGRPIPGQLPITDAIPGDASYSDLSDLQTVTVPAGYVANTITAASDLLGKIASDPTDYALTDTNLIRNLVIVPAGSTANLHLAGGPAPLEHGWYRGQLVSWLVFDEAVTSQQTTLDTSGAQPAIATNAPHIDIYVTFNKNPDPNDATSGPASGFMVDGTGRAHNVVSVLPPSIAYSPLWDIDIYNNSAFASVHDLPSAQAAPLLALNAAEVNCPVVEIQ